MVREGSWANVVLVVVLVAVMVVPPGASTNLALIGWIGGLPSSSPVDVPKFTMVHLASAQHPTLLADPVHHYDISSMRPMVVSSFIAQPYTIILGNATHLNVSVSDGLPPYSYIYANPPNGCASTNSPSLSCKPTATGLFTVNVTITDSANATVHASATFAVRPSPPIITVFAASPYTIPIGGTTFFNTTVIGGSPPYIFNYPILPSGCASLNVTALSCTPTITGGEMQAEVVVRDSKGATSTAYAYLAVLPPRLVVIAFQASPYTIPTGGTTYLNVSVQGGVPPYSYYYYNLPPSSPGCVSSNTPRLVCSPNPGFYGPSYITVSVTDSAAVTIKATAFYIIEIPGYSFALNSFHPSLSTISLGVTLGLNATLVGGATPYTLVYIGLPPGCASNNTTSLSCTPSATGSFTVELQATDKKGSTVFGNVSFAVNSLTRFHISSFAASPYDINLGETTYLNVSATGGVLPYTYTFYPPSLPPGCTSANRSSLACTPTTTGGYNPEVTVSDVGGSTATAMAELYTNPPLTITSAGAYPYTITLGSSTYLNVTAVGGIAPYTYSYSGFPPGCASADTSSLKCVPATTGIFNVRITAKDVWSASSTAICTFVVNSVEKAPTIASFMANPSTVGIGQASTLAVSASGGIGTLSYAYTGLPPGCIGADTANLSCTPNTAGSFTIRVYANDSVGDSANATTTLTVTSSSTHTLSGVSVTPSLDTLQVGKSTSFTASITCTGGACPSGVTYSWSMNNTLGSFNVTAGRQVEFTAGKSTGLVSITVTATLSGKVVQSTPVSITISSPPSSSTSGFLGLPGFEGYILIGVVVAVVAAAMAVLLLRKRSPPAPAKPSPKGEPESKETEKGEAKKEPSPEPEKQG